MAIVIEANYSKKLGLPEYSSHQYSVTLRTEVSDVNKVAEESDRLYALLQGCVDRSLQQVGFVPHANGNGKNGNGHHRNGNGHRTPDRWDCSPKQQELILKTIEENRLDKNEVDKMAQDMFGKSVPKLNKLEASGLIDALFRQTGKQTNGHNRFQPAGSR